MPMEWAVPMGTPFTLELTKHKKLYFPETQIRIKSTHPPLYHYTSIEVFHKGFLQ